MSDVGMHGVDDSNKWVKDYTGGSYATEAIPGSSGAGIFVLTTPKAIYNPTDSTFTFVYDSADHSEEVKAGSTIFPVYEKTGYVTGMIQEDIDDYSAYRLMGDTLASFVVNAGGEVLPFRPHQLGRVSQAEYYDISNLDLPSWYYLDTEAYKIECMIKNDVTVIFDSSFSMCKDIYSTSCWFMADSDGNAPFTQFKSRINGKLVDGFTNIPTNNLQSCSSMFGGFCYEAYKHHNYWYNGSDSDIPLSDPWRILPASNTGNVFVSSFLDTYNYKLSTLDLSTFNISNMNVIDYGAICANCKGLTTVTLPSRFIQPSQEDNNFDYPGTRGDYISFSAAFYGCEKLENVTNIQKFNPFTIMSKNKTFGSYSIGRMFYGCKSLKSIDLSCFDVDNYIGYSGLGYSAMYRYEDVFCGCEMLNQIKLGNG
ncbi:MAG: hypothetical protein Q4F54_04830 [Coriobacteriia bacterium]|nr:hypothetical protein [Coriobacteriia bacterium]